jgi:hypothetical protein
MEPTSNGAVNPTTPYAQSANPRGEGVTESLEMRVSVAHCRDIGGAWTRHNAPIQIAEMLRIPPRVFERNGGTDKRELLVPEERAILNS